MKKEIKVEHDEISLRSIVFFVSRWYKFLLYKKRRILLAGICGGLIGLLYSFIYTPQYIAQTSFVVESTKKGMINDYASIASKFGFSTGSGDGGLFQEDESIITFLKSRTMVSQTLYTPINTGNQTKLLAELYYEQSLKEEWKNDNRFSNLSFHANPSERRRLEDSVVSFFYKTISKENLSVEKPDEDEDVIVIKTKFSDEIFSKAFNETLLSNASKFYIEYQTKKSQQNVDILQYQVDSVRTLLNMSLTGAAISVEANPNLNPALQRLKVPYQKKQVDIEMSKAMLEELVKNLELAKIAVRKETPLVQVIDEPILPLEKTKLGKVKGVIIGILISFVLAILVLTFSMMLRDSLKETTVS